MKIQHLLALVVLSFATVPGARAAIRGGKARTLGLLALACLLVAAPATAQVNYAVSGSTAYVASSPNASGAIVIASTYNGYPVTSIGDYAFSGYSYFGCTNPTNVTIPNSVTSIRDQAFKGCTRLTSMTIPNSVTFIGGEAFQSCTSLSNLIIGNSVTAIGFYVFRECTSLTSVTIPNSVTAIGYGAFQYCTRLTSMTIPNSVTSIGFEAFYGRTNLTRLTIPASVLNIGALAFAECTSLTNFTFLGNAPRLVTDIEAGAAHFAGAPAKAYYYCGTTGWGTGYGGMPTVMLCAPQIAPGSAGVNPGGFGFTLTRLTNQTIVVEASTNLVNWQPIWTNALPGASADFIDPELINHSTRFYRARSD